MAQKKKSAAPSPAAVIANPSSGKKLSPHLPAQNAQEQAALQAVEAFEIAEKTITLFEQDPHYKATMDAYKKLIEERNTLREVADHLVRGLDVSCGPWDRYSVSVSYNADALYQHLGKATFLSVGGSINTQTVYTVDKERVEIAVKTGAIPANVVPAIRTEKPSYHAPKPRT